MSSRHNPTLPSKVNDTYADNTFEALLADNHAKRGTYSAHLTKQSVVGWHLLPANGCTTRDAYRVIAGSLLSIPDAQEIQICYNGYHSCLELADTLVYTPSSDQVVITKVESFGDLEFESTGLKNSKIVARHRFCIALLPVKASNEVFRVFVERAVEAAIAHGIVSDWERPTADTEAISKLGHRVIDAYRSIRPTHSEADQDQDCDRLITAYKALNAEIRSRGGLHNYAQYGAYIDVISSAIYALPYKRFGLGYVTRIMRSAEEISPRLHSELRAMLERLAEEAIGQYGNIANDNPLLPVNPLPTPIKAIRSLLDNLAEYPDRDQRVNDWLAMALVGLHKSYSRFSATNDRAIWELIHATRNLEWALRETHTDIPTLSFLLAQLAYYAECQQRINLNKQS